MNRIIKNGLRNEKINFIKSKLVPLISNFNLKDPNREEYRWTDGNISYYIRKDYFGDNNLLEMYMLAGRTNGNNSRLSMVCETFIYKTPYDKGYEDYIDVKEFTCQIL